MTSSAHDADLKGNNFRHTIHPQSFIAVAFIFSELDRGGFRSPPRSRRSKKKPGLDRVKFGGKLIFLKKFKGLPSSVLEEIYFNGIVPSITYCIAIWGCCSPSTFKVLEHLHLKAAKLIHNLPSETPDSDVLDLVKWKPCHGLQA